MSAEVNLGNSFWVDLEVTPIEIMSPCTKYQTKEKGGSSTPAHIQAMIAAAKERGQYHNITGSGRQNTIVVLKSGRTIVSPHVLRVLQARKYKALANLK